MAECINPFTIKDSGMQVPCGKCLNCRKRLVSSWSFRLLQEDKFSYNSWFLTLTYSPKNIRRSDNNFRTLLKRDIQLFFKRLRKAHTNKYGYSKIKYYAVGEYGGITKRPHYHVIIFNVDISLTDNAWNLGSIHYGQVSGASVGYTLKYMFKDKKNKAHKNDDRQPEFALMSKGLGEGYLTESMQRWHKADINNRMYCNLEGGKKIGMPRYYKNKIYAEQERIAVGEATRCRMLLDQEKKGDTRTTRKVKVDIVNADRNRMAFRHAKEDRL